MHSLIVSIVLLLSFSITIDVDAIDDKQSFYPPFWHFVPSSLNEFPLVNNSLAPYRLIDPWFYPHRLGLYKILINVTTSYMPFSSSSNASNILFALPSQLGWQFSSNRLFTNGTMYISTKSWWASANYYLSVIPFLIAVDIGLIKTESFRIVQQENFCTDSQQCLKQIPNAMIQWSLFFFHLQKSASCFAKEKLTPRRIDKCYLGQMWSAYKSSIYDGLPLVQSKLDYLPSKEEKLFGLGWARLLNLISMTRKNTNLYETIKNQRKFLPFRMLQVSDRSTNSTDLSDSVNNSLKVLFSFRYDRLTVIEHFWQKLTCNYEGRIYAQQILEAMALSKLLAFHYLVKATVNTLVYNCDSLSDV
ncbi:hypothetical protein I4U23_009524 [Adineta vaga]|nr:hypothetical protein I4U23_009524 [Adineta vaga]